MLTRGLGLGPSEGVPMSHNASTQAMGDGNLLNKAEVMLVIGDAKGEGLLEVSAAASAYSSAGEDSTSKGEEGTWLMTGAPLTVTSRGMSGQEAKAQEAASKGPAPEGEEGLLKEVEMGELPPTMSAARADGTRSGMAMGGMKEKGCGEGEARANRGIGPEGCAPRLKVTLRGLLSCSCPCQLLASESSNCSATPSQMSLKHFVDSAECPSTHLCILQRNYTSQLMVTVIML